MDDALLCRMICNPTRINKNSMKYHRGYVGHLPDESDRLVFISTKDAESRMTTIDSLAL